MEQLISECSSLEKVPAFITRLYNKMENIEKLLQAKNEVYPEADQLLTIQQAASFLNLCVPTIYGLVSRSEIPHSKKGKRLYFMKQDLTNWIKSGRKKTHQEIEAEADAYLGNSKTKRFTHA